MKIASRATPEGLAGHGLSTTALWHLWPSAETFIADLKNQNHCEELNIHFINIS